MRNLVVLGGSVVAALTAASAALAGGQPIGYGPSAPSGADYPPNARPGQCFAKVLAPETTETYTEQVLVSPEKTVTRVIPGDCGVEDKTVVVREPSTELITIPATFRTVTDTVVTKPGGVHTETIAPVYETVTEQIKVRDGYTAWRPGSSITGFAGTSGYGYGGMPTRVLPTGEVLCLVQVPPEFRTITKQVMRSPGRTVEIPYPPETTVVSRQVVDVPAHVEKREVPGETKIVRVKICRPDQTTSTVIPPEYRTVTKVRVLSPSRFDWKLVECQQAAAPLIDAPPPPRHIPPEPPPMRRYRPPVRRYIPPRPYIAPHHARVCHETCSDAALNLAPPTPAAVAEPAHIYGAADAAPKPGDHAVANLQAALASRGYYKGPDDGLFTGSTMTAMVRYQHDNHLAEGRYTGETANALGVSR